MHVLAQGHALPNMLGATPSPGLAWPGLWPDNKGTSIRQALTVASVGASFGLLTGLAWHLFAGVGCGDEIFIGCRKVNELILMPSFAVVVAAAAFALWALRIPQPLTIAVFAALTALLVEVQFPSPPMINGPQNLLILIALGALCSVGWTVVLNAVSPRPAIVAIVVVGAALVGIGVSTSYIQRAELRAVGFEAQTVRSGWMYANPGYVVGDRQAIRTSMTSNGYLPAERNSIFVETRQGDAASLCRELPQCHRVDGNTWRYPLANDRVAWMVNADEGLVVTAWVANGASPWRHPQPRLQSLAEALAKDHLED